MSLAFSVSSRKDLKIVVRFRTTFYLFFSIGRGFVCRNWLKKAASRHPATTTKTTTNKSISSDWKSNPHARHCESAPAKDSPSNGPRRAETRLKHFPPFLVSREWRFWGRRCRCLQRRRQWRSNQCRSRCCVFVAAKEANFPPIICSGVIVIFPKLSTQCHRWSSKMAKI